MRKTNVLLMLLIGTLMFSCNELKREDAITYNDLIVHSFDPVIDKMVDFEMAVFDGSIEEVQTIYKELEALNLSTWKTVNETPAFGDNEEFKKAAEDIVKFYISVTENEYKEIMGIIDVDALSLEDENKIDDLLGDTYEKETQFYTKFDEEQKKFADKYNFRIEDPKPLKADK